MPPTRSGFVLLCSLVLLAGSAWAEQDGAAQPAAGKPVPGKHALPEKGSAHAPPQAAPVPPVHPAGKTGVPVVKPKSTPPKSPAPHNKAAPPAAPAASAPPVPVPLPEAKPAPPAAEGAKGSATGLPLPRFAALRSDDVNMRGGPGTRYPIEWVYKRRDLPVEIEREFEVWRLVRDQEGVKGWVHQATLTGRRSFVVTGTAQTLRRDGDDGAPAVAVLKPGVIGRIRACQAGAAWCEVQVGDHRGWLQRGQFWGSYPGEAVNP